MPPSFFRDLQRGLGYLRTHRNAVGSVVALAIFSSALTAFEPLVHAAVFNRIAAPSRSVSIVVILGPIGLLAAIALVRQAVEAATTLLTWRVRLRINRQLLADATARLHTLPLSYHQGRGVGETMTRLDRGVTAFVEGLSSIAFQIVPAFTYLAFSLAIMLRLKLQLALVAVAFIAPPLLFGRRATADLVEREREQMDRWCRIYNRFHQVLSGIKTVKAFAREIEEQQQFVVDVGEAQAEVFRGVRLQTRIAAGQAVWVNLGRVVVLGVGAVMVVRHELALGSLVAFLGYAGGLYGPAQILLGAYVTIRRAELGLATVFGVLDAEDAVVDPERAASPGPLRGAVRFDRVTFYYGAPVGPASAESGVRHRHQPASPALEDVTLSIEPGEYIALVGPSGAGKSTLADLMLRLYDPTSGAVFIDGHDLRSLPQRELRRQIGIVPQEAFLFEESVSANIRYGHPRASDDDVHTVAIAAQAHEFIERLPRGYETIIGRGGVQLSGGERQRIAIARTLLKNPALVILDEPTSSLDVHAEAAVQAALDRLVAGRTTLLIAHRLGTTTRADRVIVLDRGRVVEQGPPAELLRRSGPYARMMDALREGLFEYYPRHAAPA